MPVFFEIRKYPGIKRLPTGAIILLLFVLACAGGKNVSLAPVKTFDPDNRPIADPRELEENQIWDLMDMTFFYQIEKLLDLNWSGRKTAAFLNLADSRPADNVNALDEVPNSSWYTNRHFHHPMSPEELARGPNKTDGPESSSVWKIVAGKFEGGTPGFTIVDVRGDRYIIKIDAAGYPEMGSSAEVISTKILYACGYNVPQNTIEFIRPDQLEIGETARVMEGGIKRAMTKSDLEAMLQNIPLRPDGMIRVLASKFLPGKPVGIWEYRGTRPDDPNDLVKHEHRRELRGLRVISSWLNDADRRAANTLAVYTGGEQGYIMHYLIDMGSTLGSNNKFPHAPKYGYEYLVDPRSIFHSLVSLGLYVKPWEFETAHLQPEFPSIGYFEAEMFDPGSWVPTYPNPAFENCTLRDAFWGAKIVLSFSDADLEAIVSTAHLSDPDAAEYLLNILKLRRDKVGRYWFTKINPLDRFRLVRSDSSLQLIFEDLAAATGLESGNCQYQYQVYFRNNEIQPAGKISAPAISLNREFTILNQIFNSEKSLPVTERKLKVDIRTRREKGKVSKKVSVWIFLPQNKAFSRILSIEREE
ncbi:MAG: hypothetical protein WAN36_10365 [Calditrichia bacterium]